MKGITGNPALDAYHRMAVSPINETRPTTKMDAEQSQAPAEAAKVSISAEARELRLRRRRHVDRGGPDAVRRQRVRRPTSPPGTEYRRCVMHRLPDVAEVGLPATYR